MSRKRKKNKQKQIIILSTVLISFTLITAYSAFSTKLNITAKGTVIDIKKEVDSKVPTNQLLFWGQADNKENTITTLKDKSENNNDGTLNNFDNTTSSGYNDEGLIFNGINDYVNIGLANYDFKNTISYVLYVKINRPETELSTLIGNWDYNGSGIYSDKNLIKFPIYDTTGHLVWLNSLTQITNIPYYTIVTTYDGSTSKMYIDGTLEATTTVPNLTISPCPIFIGGNPQSDGNHIEFANMILKEAMIYDRALTEEEIKSITEGFNKKYH